MSTQVFISDDKVYVDFGTGQVAVVDRSVFDDSLVNIVFQVPADATELVAEEQIDYEEAYNEGYDAGYSDGEDSSYEYSYTEDDVSDARTEGYDEGYADATRDLAVESDDED